LEEGIWEKGERVQGWEAEAKESKGKWGSEENEKLLKLQECVIPRGHQVNTICDQDVLWTDRKSLLLLYQKHSKVKVLYSFLIS